MIMAKLTADGNKLVECGEEIINLSHEYTNLINDLFEEITNIEKNAWSGKSASIYSQSALLDKANYLTFGNYLKCYGSAIKNAGVNINNIIDKWGK